jgi:RHS repeat-associated protein
VENLNYRPFGGARAMDTGGGGSVGSQFDNRSRITISNPGAEHEETFTYDNNGNLTSITSLSLPYHNRVYGYDALDRLEHAEGPWGIIDYTYDDVGNRQTKTVDGVTDTYAYVTGTNIIDSISNGTATTYTHDANGNITGINNKILTYNQNNRLISVEEDSVTLGEYIYNGLGQRIIKEADGVTTVFHYDFDGNIIGESDAAGSFSKEYLYRGSSRLALVDVSSEEIYYYGNDHLGTPIILTDSTNTVVWEAVYKPFGEAEVNPNSEVVNNFRFAGQYFDEETGLHYNYYRYYNPSTERYLKADPIGLDGGINLYAYVDNNPINDTDFIGLARYLVWFDMKSVSVVIAPVGRTKITGTVVSTKRNPDGTYSAIQFEGIFYGGALGPLPLAETINNIEYF